MDNLILAFAFGVILDMTAHLAIRNWQRRKERQHALDELLQSAERSTIDRRQRVLRAGLDGRVYRPIGIPKVTS